MTVLPDDAPTGRLAPLSPPTLVEAVAEAIRTSILTGRFVQGARLVETELARELQVSRGPVREALGLLAKDGIVVHEPRRGKYVQAFTPKLIDELYSLRRVLEPYAASLVIAHLDQAAADDGPGPASASGQDAVDATAPQRLIASLAAITAAAAAGDEPRLASADVAFHDLLFVLAEHELLRRAWLENIAGKLRLMSNVTTRSLTALADAGLNHQRLLEPILAGDVEGARRQVEHHIDEAWELAKVEFEALSGGRSEAVSVPVARLGPASPRPVDC